MGWQFVPSFFRLRQACQLLQLIWQYCESHSLPALGYVDMRGWEQTPGYLIRDRDACYGTVFTRRLRSLGIRDHPTSPRSPWQNRHAERLIGSIRRECLGHVGCIRGAAPASCAVVLHRLLQCGSHASILGQGQTGATRRSITGRIQAQPVLGGLHHQYARIDLRQGQDNSLL
jgi:hypothetical protein